MIAELIKTLHKSEYYRAGKFTELAKGKNELCLDKKGVIKKIKRIWRSRK